MGTYYVVTFTFETSTDIEVEADSVEQAKELARAEMDERDPSDLPEMWPSDFMVSNVEGVPSEWYDEVNRMAPGNPAVTTCGVSYHHSQCDLPVGHDGQHHVGLED